MKNILLVPIHSYYMNDIINIRLTNVNARKIGDYRKLLYLYCTKEQQRITNKNCYNHRMQSYRIILYGR